MADTDATPEPDWESPLELSLTPALLIHALFPTAESVHTGWRSCVDNKLVVADLSTIDERTGNYSRLAEQEFVEDGAEEEVWHDWVVEVRIGDVLIAGHWYAQLGAPPMEWEWSTREAETAFDKACVLIGRRIRRGVVVDEPTAQPPPPTRRHHGPIMPPTGRKPPGRGRRESPYPGEAGIDGRRDSAAEAAHARRRRRAQVRP